MSRHSDTMSQRDATARTDARLHDTEQRLRDAQSRAEDLQLKLDALIAVERNLNKRSVK